MEYVFLFLAIGASIFTLFGAADDLRAGRLYDHTKEALISIAFCALFWTLYAGMNNHWQ